jgi:hypothetical protein
LKILFIILACMVINSTACKKNNNKTNCTTVTITNTAPGCGGWGIIVNGTKYPSRNIPLQYQQNNLVVCADYELYDDKALCGCCGGTWADIKSMQ